MISGLASYLYLAVAARTLGPERYSALSVLWALTFLTALGFFVPIEQEVSRALAARRVHGHGGAPVVRRAASLAGLAVVVLLVTITIGRSRLRGRLFDGSGLLVIGLGLGLAGYAGLHLLRGMLAGQGRFAAYAVLVAAEPVLRLAAALVLWAGGAATVGSLGLVLGGAPIATAVLALSATRHVTTGPDVGWNEVGVALADLVMASLLVQVLMNGPAVAAKLLAGQAEQAEAGTFVAALVLTRVPLFLFAAVQAALLPHLSALASRRRHHAFVSSVRRVAALSGLAGAVFAGFISIAGPGALRIVFGRSFSLARPQLAALAAGSGIAMVTLVMAQALIALSAHRLVAIGWVVAVGGSALTLFIHGGLSSRVARAFLLGSLAGALAMAVLLWTQVVRSRSQPGVSPPEAPGLIIEPV